MAKNIEVKQYDNPTRLDQEEFLIRLYFGEKRDYLEMCIDRAYLDFNRTLHGMKNHPDIYASAKVVIKKSLQTLAIDTGRFHSSDEFDNWHKNLCIALCKHYANNGFATYHVGQAQKWINMTLKYVFTMGESRLSNYSNLYGFCHIPIDNIIIENLKKDKHIPPPLKSAWSRLDNYDLYMEFQIWVRRHFSGSAPLAVEFSLWQKPNLATLDVETE